MTALERIIEQWPDEEFMKMDGGYDDCIVGVGRRCGQPLLLIYDPELIVKVLMERDGMELEEAWEFYEFNQVGAWMGELTPIFLEHVPEE